MDARPGYADKAFTLIKLIDSWKKLFILIVLTFFVGVFYLSYHHRVEISTALFM